jgi:hypothetical protein
MGSTQTKSDSFLSYNKNPNNISIKSTIATAGKTGNPPPRPDDSPLE